MKNCILTVDQGAVDVKNDQVHDEPFANAVEGSHVQGFAPGVKSRRTEPGRTRQIGAVPAKHRERTRPKDNPQPVASKPLTSG